MSSQLAGRVGLSIPPVAFPRPLLLRRRRELRARTINLPRAVSSGLLESSDESYLALSK